MIETITEYARGIGAKEEIQEWCKTILAAAHRKESVSISDAEHIIDFLMSNDAPTRLRRMSFAQAKAGADAWTKKNQKHGKDIEESDKDAELFMELDNGSRIVKLLTPNAFKREGFLMRHCVGSMNPENASIYSLRDSSNNPHVTFEVARDGKTIQQIKGKGNGCIHPRYINSTLEFLKRVGLEIRPADMSNLGYYHVTHEAQDMMNRFILASGESPQFIPLGGHEYLFKGAK